MAVPSETIALVKLEPVAGIPIDVAIGVFGSSEVYVTYGRAGLEATPVTDYTVTLVDPDNFDTFSVTPTASLTTKIANLIIADDTELDQITVRRIMEFTGDSTPGYALHTRYVSKEIDRSVARDQQLKESLSRTLQLSLAYASPAPRLEGPFAPNKALVMNAAGTALVDGPTASDIAGAQGYAEAAAQSKTDAETAKGLTEGYRDQVLEVLEDVTQRVWTAAELGIVSTNTVMQNDTAIAAVTPGLQVDLGRKLIPATKVPDGFFTHNGSFIDADDKLYPLMREPYDSFLSGNLIEIKKFEAGTFWPAGMFWRAGSTDELWMFWIETPTHGAVPPMGTLQAGVAEGAFYPSKSFTIDTDDTGYLYNGAIAHQIDSGGYLVVVRRWDTGTAAIKGAALISAGFAAPTMIDLEAEGITDDPFWYGQAVRWPAEFGGHNTKGWLYASYAGASASARIVRTDDEGATGSWSQVTIGGNVTGFNPNECSVVVIPGQGAIAFCRGNDGQNMHYSVSTDSTLSTWSAWTDSGIKMGDNPPHAQYHHGVLELAITDREAWSDVTGGSGPKDNVIRLYRLDPVAIFATGGELPKAHTVDYHGSNRLVGYMFTAYDQRGVPATMVKMGETQFATSTENERASMGLITPYRIPLASPSVIKRQPRQLLLNSNFQDWPYGTGKASTSDEIILANWRSATSGATITFSKETLTNDERRMAGHGQRYAMGIDSTADADNNSGFTQRRRGWDGNELASIFHSHARGVAVLEGFGVPTGLLSIETKITGISGAADQLKNNTFVQPVVRNDGFWRTEIPVVFPTVPSGGSFTDTTYGEVRLDNEEADTSAYAAKLTRFELWMGDVAGHRDAADMAAQRAISACYGGTYTGRSGTTGVNICPMQYRAGGVNAWQGFFDLDQSLVEDLVSVDFSSAAHFEIVSGASATACSAISAIELAGSREGFGIQATAGTPSDKDFGFLRFASDSGAITWKTGY